MLAALSVAGCGGGPDERAAVRCVPASDVAADVGRRAGAGTAVAIAAVDDRFEPACIEGVDAGPVTIVVRNDGRHPHNLTVPDGARVAVDAGQVAFVETTIDAGGIRYRCTIHPGMRGEIRAGRS